MPSSSPRLVAAGLCVLAAAATGCRGRVSVDGNARPFDAATETVRAEAAQLAARADTRLRTVTDSATALRIRASRDSLLTALDALATSPDTASASSRRALSDLGTRVLRSFRSADSAAAASANTPR